MLRARQNCCACPSAGRSNELRSIGAPTTPWVVGAPARQEASPVHCTSDEGDARQGWQKIAKIWTTRAKGAKPKPCPRQGGREGLPRLKVKHPQMRGSPLLTATKSQRIQGTRGSRKRPAQTKHENQQPAQTQTKPNPRNHTLSKALLLSFINHEPSDSA